MPVLKALTEAGYIVSHFKSKSLKDDTIFEEFKKLNPDLCIVAAYGKIISAKYLSVPKYGFVNIHPSLLPKYRGPSPVQTAILNEDKETGVSIMVVDAEIDHGPVLASREFSISNFQFSNHDELAKELFELGAKLLIKTLPKYINGELEVRPQEHEKATFTKMFKREDGRINWSESGDKIYAQIRALNPEPGTWSIWRGNIINIKKAELDNEKIEIKTIQMEGKKEMSFEEFLRGHRDFNISQLK